MKRTNGSITITSDEKIKQFKYRHEVPAKILKDHFGHLSEDEAVDGFFKYRGYWYHLSDFMRITPGMAPHFNRWSGYLSDSFFSGIVIMLLGDMETYKIGRFYS